MCGGRNRFVPLLLLLLFRWDLVNFTCQDGADGAGLSDWWQIIKPEEFKESFNLASLAFNQYGCTDCDRDTVVWFGVLSATEMTHSQTYIEYGEKFINFTSIVLCTLSCKIKNWILTHLSQLNTHKNRYRWILLFIYIHLNTFISLWKICFANSVKRRIMNIAAKNGLKWIPISTN